MYIMNLSSRLSQLLIAPELGSWQSTHACIGIFFAGAVATSQAFFSFSSAFDTEAAFETVVSGEVGRRERSKPGGSKGVSDLEVLRKRGTG